MNGLRVIQGAGQNDFEQTLLETSASCTHLFCLDKGKYTTTTTRSTLYAHLLHLLASRLANKTAPIP